MTDAPNSAVRSYRSGGWFAIFGEHASVLLPGSEKSRVASIWELVDAGTGFDELLDALIASGLRSLPSFVLISSVDDPSRIVLRGAARATFVLSDGETVEVDGGEASTWVERTLPGVEKLTLHLEDEVGDLGQDFPIIGGLVRVSRVDQPPLVAVSPPAATETGADPIASVATGDADAVDVAQVEDLGVADGDGADVAMAAVPVETPTDEIASLDPEAAVEEEVDIVGATPTDDWSASTPDLSEPPMWAPPAEGAVPAAPVPSGWGTPTWGTPADTDHGLSIFDERDVSGEQAIFEGDSPVDAPSAPAWGESRSIRAPSRMRPQRRRGVSLLLGRLLRRRGVRLTRWCRRPDRWREATVTTTGTPRPVPMTRTSSSASIRASPASRRPPA
ncbi:MAG: hypothetical protein L0H93_09825 [Nocardioides sp.]|nr:hypothetical protein [Nocardioides sp.]